MSKNNLNLKIIFRIILFRRRMLVINIHTTVGINIVYFLTFLREGDTHTRKRYYTMKENNKYRVKGQKEN